mgnify:CR=1 FL=1
MNPLKSISRRTKQTIQRLYLPEKIQAQYPLEFHGSDYGGWTIFPHSISAESIAYSFGVGEDISFDLSLIEKYGLQIYAFDPTPRSIDWVKSQVLPPQFHLFDYGIAAQDGIVNFYPPENRDCISHTMLNRTTTADRAIQVQMRRLTTITKMLGHHKIDILKMDIEGAEYAVIEDILKANDLNIPQILIEFHHRFKGIGPAKTRTAIKLLNHHGYQVFHIAPSGLEYSFIKKTG